MAGAQVLVAAWPSNETVRALPAGAQFDVLPVARTTAGRDGSYELRALLTPVLAALTGPDGLDIELNVFHDCVSYTMIGDPKPAMTTVATAIARNGAGMKTLYEAGATTATSTGFSFDGGVSFSVNGARERTMTTGADFYGEKSKPGQLVAREYQAVVKHQTLRRVCKGDKYDEYRVQYVTTPTGLTGGTSTAALPTAWTCNRDHVALARGAKEVHTTNHRAATYGGAFSFKPLGGVSFSGNSLSGYSETVRVAFRFARGANGFWCGDSGDPASPGQRVQGFVG